MSTLEKMSLHYPEGLAAAKDTSGAFHVDAHNVAAYSHRYLKTYGFYGGLATVVDRMGFFHIDSCGNPVHEQRFLWAGNYQDSACVVETSLGYFHVNTQGARQYADTFDYVGDYREGIAVAYQNGEAFHINKAGQKIYPLTLEYAEPFHKGYAVVRDSSGFFHIDKAGNSLHNHRFSRAEPFYNNLAYCELRNGKKIRLRENGQYTLIGHRANALTAQEVTHLLEKGDSVAILLRHADRAVITANTPNWGNDLPITDKGKQRVQALTHALPKNVIPYLATSPVKRCIDTGNAIRSAFEPTNVSLSINPLLGNPGVYFDGTHNHEEEMAKGLYQFVEHYVREGTADGMRSLVEASTELETFVTETLNDNKLSFLISHDVHIECFASFLGLKTASSDQWCEFLEGVCFWKHNNQVHLARFISPDLPA